MIKEGKGMDVNNIVSIINSVGFPIATTCFLAWYMVKCNERTNDILTDFKETLTELKTIIKEREDK